MRDCPCARALIDAAIGQCTEADIPDFGYPQGVDALDWGYEKVEHVLRFMSP